jgi:hypothetical protein
VSINGRAFTTDSNKVDEPFKVEEAETVPPPPPPTEKVFYNYANILIFLVCVCIYYGFTNLELCIYVLGVVEVACVGRKWICWITCL